MREMTLANMLTHLAGIEVAMLAETGRSLERAAKVVEAEAKGELGKYQGEAGPFAGWAELAESTKADRVHKGYPENDPLLRDGTMRDSIHHAVEVTGAGAGVAIIGSDSDIAVYQELGTAKMPPRSFLGGAAVRTGHKVAEILGHGVVTALVGKDVVGGRLEIP